MIQLKYRLVILFFLLFSLNLQAQFDARWVLGTFSQLCFSPPPPSLEKGDFDVLIPWNNASICDKRTGELLIFCHGSIIFNKLGLPMQNGDTINPGKYFFNNYPTDQPGFEGSLILPYSNQNNKYIVLYTNVDSLVPGELLPTKLYYSIVDMSFNNGLGKVIKKDVPLLDHLLEPGRINAIQHANGRDWWILQNGFQDTKHYIYLLDPSGIKLYSTQAIGSVYNKITPYEYQTCVNQSGNQIVYLYGTKDSDHQHRIDLYNFDRCSGFLYNYKAINIVDSLELLGCSFSPNDSLLYVSNMYNVFQLNLKNVDDTSIINVGEWDSTIDPVATLFYFQKITPTNEIIISTYGATRVLHCIKRPNIRGSGCNFFQGYIKSDSSNHYFGGSLPNTPNFRLGALIGSDCDTIREVKPPMVNDGVLLYPNPCRDELLINSKWLIGNTSVVVYNILGQKALSFSFKNSVGIETINVSSLAKAIYLLQIIDASGTIHNRKFVKE